MTQAQRPKTPRELLDEVDRKILEIDKDLALEVFKDVFNPLPIHKDPWFNTF